MRRTWVVTGCYGFLGKHLTATLLRRGDSVYGIDVETYAADLNARAVFDAQPGKFSYRKVDIAALDRLPDVDVVVHCAAETHVDNSLTDAERFVRTNVLGTQRLLDLVRTKPERRRPLFVHISTDEVFGPSHFPRYPDDILAPSNPYSASKAAAEHLVTAAGRTFGIPYLIVRPTNLYGTGQYPEKLVPKASRLIRQGRRVPIHGDGSAKRSWLSVEDAVSGILAVVEHGLPGVGPFHLGGNTTASVRTVVEAIGAALGVSPTLKYSGPDPIAEYEYQRPGLDLAYSLDDTGTRRLGWSPVGDFWKDLPTVLAGMAVEPDIR
jgi:dTDP-glucose 4,6-dehydratase